MNPFFVLVGRTALSHHRMGCPVSLFLVLVFFLLLLLLLLLLLPLLVVGCCCWLLVVVVLVVVLQRRRNNCSIMMYDDVVPRPVEQIHLAVRSRVLNCLDPQLEICGTFRDIGMCFMFWVFFVESWHVLNNTNIFDVLRNPLYNGFRYRSSFLRMDCGHQCPSTCHQGFGKHLGRVIGHCHCCPGSS